MTYHLTYSDGVLSADAGRVKVAYFEEHKKLRVIRISDSVMLVGKPFEFSLTGFIEEVERYNEMCNI